MYRNVHTYIYIYIYVKLTLFTIRADPEKYLKTFFSNTTKNIYIEKSSKLI